MALLDLAHLSDDGNFLARCAACYATQPGAQLDAWEWAAVHKWALAASPGFSDAYAYARETGVQDPGGDPAVITDAAILAATQAVIAADPETEEV